MFVTAGGGGVSIRSGDLEKSKKIANLGGHEYN